MSIGRSSKRKDREEEWHSYKKDRGIDLKITCSISKGKKHDDSDVHIQAFEKYAELKHILEEEWEKYFPHTLKEVARKWFYHYPTLKLQSYKKLKKSFVLEYTNDQGDEDIMCKLDRIKQGKLSVKKYVQKIKELTKRLNESPSKKKMRAWFLSGFNSKKLKEQEVSAPTKKFTELVHRALKLEQQAKKEKHRHKANSFDSSTSESSEAEKTSTSASKLEEEEKEGKLKNCQVILEKKKLEVPKCSKARTIQRIPIAITEALRLETQGTGGNVWPIDSSDNSNSFGNEQDEVEVKMCRRIEKLTIELEDLRQSLPVVTKFIKKKKQAKSMKVDTPQIKDDEVPTIQLYYKNKKQWKPLTSVILDGGAGVNIIGEHMKDRMGITNIKPAPFRVRMANQRIVQPTHSLVAHLLSCSPLMAQERRICALEKELDAAIASAELARAQKRLVEIAQRATEIRGQEVDGVIKIGQEASRLGYRHFDCAVDYKNAKELSLW
ncbi:hypothetical protein L7F22_029220 [Adiantum nelumboides]|nr:hypothetical protein [Adiantum nelumboides]